MIFRSEKSGFFMVGGAVLILLMAGAVAAAFWVGFFMRWFLAVLMAGCAALILYAMLDTRYEFAEHSLMMKCGVFREQIAYNQICRVTKTRGYTYMMAMAVNRLTIDRVDGGPVLNISPEREDEFIAELKKRCPDLEVVQKSAQNPQ